MEGLVKFEEHKLPEHINVKKSVREIYNANNSLKIKDISDKNTVVKQIHVFINYTILDKGINLEPTEINYIKTRVVDDIMRDFSHLSVDDIKLAFYYGVRGEFGEYFGINPITFYSWLKSYKTQMLPSVYKEVSPLLLKSQEQADFFDYKQFDMELVDNLCVALDDLTNTGSHNLFDFGNVYYSFLNRMELLDLNEKDVDYCKNKAKIKVKSNLSESNANYKKQGKSFHRINLIDAFENIEKENNNDFNVLIETEFKRAVLDFTLDQYKINKLNLREILIEKIESFDYEKYNATSR
jgi:hypothetical protein